MPLDTTTSPTDLRVAVYLDRRERACRLWESVPEDRFDMGDWDCGTTACALGWLARFRIDGWGMHSDEWNGPCWPRTSSDPDVDSYVCASLYFGIRETEAMALFSTTARYGKPLSQVTPADVAARLRATPVTVGDGL